MQVAMCFTDGSFTIINHYEPVHFHKGDVLVIENGKAYRIKEIQHQLGTGDRSTWYRCCNLIVEEKKPNNEFDLTS